MLKLSQISEWMNGELRGADASFDAISIDTRTIQAGQLYFSLRGANFDGNEFVPAAHAAGACGAVVERWVDAPLPQIKVSDGRLGLGEMAARFRQGWSGRLVGITGSNGKTTIKEMTAAILGQDGLVHKTKGNLNNDIGVPLTLLQLRPEHRYAVIEMGANHQGEIAYSSRLASADVAILGNAGAAHLEGFGSLEGVARGKGEIISGLPETGCAVLNADDRFFSYWLEVAGTRRVVSFGQAENATVRAVPDSIRSVFDEQGFGTSFDLVWEGRKFPMKIGVAGTHNVANALAASAAALAIGLTPEQVRLGLADVRPVGGRLEPVRGVRGAWLVNDAYNANPTSFRAALEAMRAVPRELWVALGAFGELGPDSPELHAELGREAKSLGVTRLFAVGPNAERAVEAFGGGAIYCANLDELIERIGADLSDAVALLVKGSRSQRMERVVEGLRDKGEPCC